ncbi:uncharacterized protein B0I36DRAFT_353069 [Microdochium trichocladiopsis]|uniref:Uncharacterized protein n=1 Tax=Microdochium trichocladiopsis TaxID=1682393 RepID=A0A9P9BPT8_9PEZI|nr:uncharacterized protein B0I36DRAFT_353069 [Microdochium trichocladiopsis]KAH7024881.1 hypothetical protein B0I36DRAFT_353069 [Microdochium trichocladiopsis]
MRCPLQFIPILAAVSATDVLMFLGRNDCTSGHVLCRNINPGACCRSSLAVFFQSLAIEAVPEGVEATLYGARDGFCANKTPMPPGRSCLPGMWSGAGWTIATGTVNTKDREADCQEADLLILEDGTAHSLVDVTEEELMQLVSALRKGTLGSRDQSIMMDTSTLLLIRDLLTIDYSPRLEMNTSGV